MLRTDPVQLVLQLSKIDTEKPWLEFKENLTDPDKIGRTISALSNGATLSDREIAYLIWGVNDQTHEIVGTSFNIDTAKKGNENLLNWLRSSLSPNVNFEHTTCKIDEKNVIVLAIGRAYRNPALFRNMAYIRDESYVKSLFDIPVLEQKLWRQLQTYSFETSFVSDSIPSESVEELLDCKSILNQLRYPYMKNPDSLMGLLEENDLISKQDDGGYCITAHGAILFAKNLLDFNSLSHKTIRLIKYKNDSKFDIEKEIEITKGYAIGLKDVEKYLSLLLPSSEKIDGAERETVFDYPPIAIRELIANALIHQDFTQNGMSILVEIFSNKVVVSNPGKILVDTNRIVNTAPISRNEKIARTMRRMGLCEELGSGWDRIVESCEEYLLPAPSISCTENSTTISIIKKKDLSEMSTDEKIWSCYLHACTLYARNLRLTNASLRKRFGIEKSNSGNVIASRIIKDTKNKALIKPFDEHAAPKNSSYIPYWA